MGESFRFFVLKVFMTFRYNFYVCFLFVQPLPARTTYDFSDDKIKCPILVGAPCTIIFVSVFRMVIQKIVDATSGNDDLKTRFQSISSTIDETK